MAAMDRVLEIVWLRDTEQTDGRQSLQMAVERANLQYQAVPDVAANASSGTKAGRNAAANDSGGLPPQQLGAVGRLYRLVRHRSAAVKTSSGTISRAWRSGVQRSASAGASLREVSVLNDFAAPPHSSHTGPDAGTHAPTGGELQAVGLVGVVHLQPAV